MIRMPRRRCLTVVRSGGRLGLMIGRRQGGSVGDLRGVRPCGLWESGVGRAGESESERMRPWLLVV